MSVGDLLGAIASRHQAVALWQDVGDRRRSRARTSPCWPWRSAVAGQRDEARQACQAAIDLLEALPPGRELALAYRELALLHQYNHDLADSIALAERAITLAEQAGDARVLAMAYDTLGLASMYLDFERGRQHLERALAIAREAGLDSRVATAYCQSRLELGASSSTSTWPSAT